MLLAANTILGRRYVIQRKLGQGGLGAAYLAEDLLRGARVAVKLLRVASPERVETFRAEFLRLRGLVHPHLCQVYDFGAARSQDGELHYFYSAEYVEGVTLDHYAEGRTWSEIAGPFAQALAALGLLHSLAIRHGDVKPANILVNGSGRAVLIDLSCSQPIDASAPTLGSGTEGFIAPEVLNEKPVDHRADLYGAGETLTRIAERLRSPLPAAVEKLRRRLLRKSPSERPSDVAEVLDALAVPVPKTPVPSADPARLLGRDKEMALFRAMLDALTEGREGARCLYVHGGEGSGKTRLLQEMKWIAVLRCSVVEGYPTPIAPITSMLQRATGDASISSDLAGLLRAREILAKASDPLVLVVDDAHRLPAPELELLHGLVRILTPTDPFLLVCADAEAPAIASPAVQMTPLLPLSEADVTKWTRGSINPKRLPDVMRLTGGFPASIHALLSLLKAGECSEQELSRLAGKAPLSERTMESIRALGREAARALGVFAVWRQEEALNEADLAALGISRDVLSHLLHRGFIQAEPAGLRLARSGEAPRILQTIDPDLAKSLHAIAAERLRLRLSALPSGSAAASAHTARLIEHLFLAGKEDEASRLFLESRALSSSYPSAWPDTAQTLAKARPEPAIMLRAAEIHEAADMPAEALGLIEALRRARPSAAWMSLIKLRAGAIHFKRGNVHEALRELGEVLDKAADLDVRAQALELMSRVHSSQGDHAKALEYARTALAECGDVSVEANLYDDIGLAAAYLGDTDMARDHLSRAVRLHEQRNDFRAQLRSIDLQAFTELRAGKPAAAANRYRRALELAERYGTSEQIARAVHNYAAACHQRGEYGEALASYGRALRAAEALGRTRTEVTLRKNLAKLYADIGQFDRAETEARRAVTLALEADMQFMKACAEQVLGEVALARGDVLLAIERFEVARREFEMQGTAREIALVWLLCAEAHLAQGDAPLAEQAIAQAQRSASSLRAADVIARTELLQAKARLAEDEPRMALSHLDEAHRLSEAIEQRWFQAMVEQTLAVVFERQDSRNLAERHRTAARELWERTAATLPQHLKEGFWRHPARRGLADPERRDIAKEHPRSPTAREKNLERLLDINKKLNSSLDSKVVLNYTIDSAIELTESERGFVILRRRRDGESDGDGDGELSVAVARRMDHETMGKSLRYSRRVVDRVIRTGKPLILDSAQDDQNFSSSHSVHELRLQSIIGVPIRSAGTVIGALCLDHRSRRGLFTQEVKDLLSAFADQVAIALTNARLHAEIARRNEELQAKQARIEELLRGKEAEIDRKDEEIGRLKGLAKDPPRAYRHDYSSIIGRGPAMCAVLDKLDRVIDTKMNVLIQGESGTGKELFANAIHANGPHKDGAIVAFNCSSVPENLIEAELFGAKRGAYTGLHHDRPGLIIGAHKGTLFLDEIGEMPLDMQAKLLRVLQERKVRPLGDVKEIPIDIRLVCATNRSLRDEVAEGRFREDLFWRIQGHFIELPPLRERREDIPELARHILERVAPELNRTPPKLTPEALRLLVAHPWDGNVRALEHVLKDAICMADGDTLTPAHLNFQKPGARSSLSLSRSDFEEEEARSIRAALQRHRGNVSETCKDLGIPRATFYRKIHRYGLKSAEARGGRGEPQRPRAPAKVRRRPKVS